MFVTHHINLEKFEYCQQPVLALRIHLQIWSTNNDIVCKKTFFKSNKTIDKIFSHGCVWYWFYYFFSGVVQNYLHIFHWRQVYFGLYPRIRRMSIEHVRWWRSSRVSHDIDVQTCYCRTPNISIRYDVIKPQTAIST